MEFSINRATMGWRIRNGVSMIIPGYQIATETSGIGVAMVTNYSTVE